jgi:hypothetical protein
MPDEKMPEMVDDDVVEGEPVPEDVEPSEHDDLNEPPVAADEPNAAGWVDASPDADPVADIAAMQAAVEKPEPDGMAGTVNETQMPPDEPAVPAEEDETAAAPGDDDDEPDAKPQMFDADAFKDPKLKIAPVDGREVDRIAFAVSGTVTLDRKNPDHVAKINAAKLGHDAEFQISCVVTGRSDKAKVSDDGYIEQVTRTIHVQATDLVFDVTE